MNPSRALFSGPATANISRAVSRALAGSSPATATATGLQCSHTRLLLLLHPPAPLARRPFSSTAPTRLEFFEPPRNAPGIKLTPPAWSHPVYSEQDMRAIQIAHRESKTWSDWVALAFCRLFRKGMDLSTGYRHDPNKAYVMNERKWLVRFIFLESIAGVPGMCAGMLRHLRSLRRMNRDNGWIETLLEEAYNERMHLLTFLKMAEPGWFMKFMILGAQGVFFNGFFLSYLVSPKTCHRFVGYIEEEAVKTYTCAIQDIDDDKLPAWETLQAPEIAVRYWKMPEGKRTMKDLLLYVRADEAKHREVNHTLGNLNQAQDPNPFVSEYQDPAKPHPGKGIEHLKPIGWDRKEVL